MSVYLFFSDRQQFLYAICACNFDTKFWRAQSCTHWYGFVLILHAWWQWYSCRTMKLLTARHLQNAPEISFCNSTAFREESNSDIYHWPLLSTTSWKFKWKIRFNCYKVSFLLSQRLISGLYSYEIVFNSKTCPRLDWLPGIIVIRPSACSTIFAMHGAPSRAVFSPPLVRTRLQPRAMTFSNAL